MLLAVVLDCDTANEIDDLYAIVRALREPSFAVMALSSAQWAHHLSGPDTVLRSQKLNEDILRLMGRQEIPVPLGAEMIMGKPWGGDEPRDSAAAQFIIGSARKAQQGTRLVIAATGASTNVASAIKLAPDIVPKISVYLMGGQCFADRGVWNKDEFNFRRDLNAINFLLDTEGLDLHVMPANVCRHLRFDQEETLRRLQGRGGVWDYLAARWLSHSPGAKQWTMWDLALIQALANPKLAKEQTVRTPPENVQRDVHVYTEIDVPGMMADWWQMVEGAG